MAKNHALSSQEFESQSLMDFAEKAYLDYSMYVILDRALPSIGDGLKPVQRRIIYAMSELGLKATAKYKKSARTVGDVLGKFHPHGDTACYEAMVLMAQNFSYRYPFIDGQGNWGSVDDPKSFAAMRYTESRLSRYADCLLSELDHGTVDWQANFDGSLQEPKQLPARVPNVLLNGGAGIAVGMATDIPPHNLREVCRACIHLLENPQAKLDELFDIIQGPDFPTYAEIITPRAEIQEIYRRGHGSLKARAIFEQDDTGDIIITALPYQVSPAKVLEQIAQQMQAKKLPMLVDLRDESDSEQPIRLVLVTRSKRIEVDALMSHLFATTDLEKNYRVNFNMIGLNGRPQVKNLLSLLQEWLQFRSTVVTRRLAHRLRKVEDRLHILAGYLIAFLNIDEVIAIIREEEQPKSVLMSRFQLTERQAEAILELKLRHLAKLEEIKIKGEQELLQEERRSLKATLDSPQRLNKLMSNELAQIAKDYGDSRRSTIIERQAGKVLSQEALLPSEPITVVLSEKGWVRAAKGHEVDARQLSYKSGDGYLADLQMRSHQPVIFLDSSGRTYSLPAHTLPSARGQGEPLTGRLSPPSGSHFVGLMTGDESSHWLLASDAGYGFIVPFPELMVKNRNGKAILKLPSESRVLPPVAVTNYAQDQLAVVSQEGRLLIFPVRELPILSRGKGNKIMNIPAARHLKGEERVQCITVLPPGSPLVVYSGKRQLTLKPKDLANYQGERGKRGVKLPRGYQQVQVIEPANLKN